jgi:histone acetyltransferase (RNA polymerase elongator complex component)
MSAREHILPVFVPHFGCPHDCVFCNQRHISGEQTPATAESVRQIIWEAEHSSTDKKPQLAFYGGSFTAIPEEDQLFLLQAAKEALDRGAVSSVRLSTRPDAIDESVLRRLHAYGVKTVELGAQSLCDEVLRLSGRGHSAEDVRRASRMIKESGFCLILQMMTGLPGDTPSRSLATAKEIISLKPDGMRIYPTVIVQDTALYTLWKRKEYREHTVEDAVSLCARLVPLFEAADIPVIRIGLNPTEELSAGAAVAGAYHPALGELVRSRMLRNEAESLLQGTEPGSRICLEVAPGKLSQMIGHHRENLRFLKERFALSSVTVKTNPEIGDREMRFFVEKTQDS